MGADRRWLEEQGRERPRPRPAAAGFGPPSCRPHGGLDHRHARGPAAGAAAASAVARGPRQLHSPRGAGRRCSSAARRASTRTGRGSSCGGATRAEPSRWSRTPATPSGPMTIAWVVPPWSVGSGGHTTIFRLVRQMEQRGHSCSIHLFDTEHAESRAGGELRDEIRRALRESTRPCSATCRASRGADVAIATEWRTAFPVRDLPGCREKVYLVQDDEPQFYATSSESIWAEESYRMGYRCIAYTPWMADILRERYGLEARYFECGTDLDVYEFAGEEWPRAGPGGRLRAPGDRAAGSRAGARRARHAVRAPAEPARRRFRLQPRRRRAVPARGPRRAPAARAGRAVPAGERRASCSRSRPTRSWPRR